MPLSGSHTSITTQLWRLRSAKRAAEEASVASASEPLEPQLLLLTKPPHTTSIRYPFASDPVLREEYCNPWGKVRLGKLLEDLDSLAGTIAFDHWCDVADLRSLQKLNPVVCVPWATATITTLKQSRTSSSRRLW
jgi:hypothetical protein